MEGFSATALGELLKGGRYFDKARQQWRDWDTQFKSNKEGTGMTLLISRYDVLFNVPDDRPHRASANRRIDAVCHEILNNDLNEADSDGEDEDGELNNYKGVVFRQLIFVSLDDTEKDFNEVNKHSSWCALDFKDAERRLKIGALFGATPKNGRVPLAVIVDGVTFEIINPDATDAFLQRSPSEFPFTS